MVNKEYPRIGERIYHTEPPSGLHIYMDWRPEFQKSYAPFATNYGGVDMKFRLGGQWRDTPAGMARLLEHKAFDTGDGNALQDPVANGASLNAFTNSAPTGYYFENTEKFCDNPEILFSFASTPWFTQESVNKEQGIIGQETRVVENDPDNQVFYSLMECLFDHHPIRIPVIGTQESIFHITTNALYACHKVLYTPSNMVSTMARGVEPEEVMRIAREILPEESGGHIKQDYGKEEDGAVVESKKKLHMEVFTPVFQLGFKTEPAPTGEEHLRRQLTGGLVCKALLGNFSPLYVRLYSEDLISKNFGYGFEFYPGYSLMAAGGESHDPRAMRNAVLAERTRIVREGVGEGLFRRLKRGVYGAKMRDLNSLENMCIELAQAHFAGVGYLILPEVFDGIPKAGAEDCTRRWVTPERCGLAVARPGEEA